jgi:hypothetical protein
MRSIDDIIADAQQRAERSLREAFALAAVERAVELKARYETAFLDHRPEPAHKAVVDEGAVTKGDHLCRQTPRPQSKPGRRAILLGVVALLTLALWHARAARLLPAYALLIGLGALLREWTEDYPDK